MKKTISTKFQVKDKTARAELVRAHSMIVLLVISFTFILALNSSFQVTLDPLLSFICILLLSVVGVLSLTVVISLLRKK